PSVAAPCRNPTGFTSEGRPRRAALTWLSRLHQFLKTRARYLSVRNITRSGSARIEAVARAWATSFDPIIGHRLTWITIAASVSSARADPAKRFADCHALSFIIDRGEP